MNILTYIHSHICNILTYEGRNEYSFILFYTVIIEQGTQRVTYSASDYNVQPLLTDRTGQQSCFFRSARSRSYNMIYENIKYIQKFVKKCFKKLCFYPKIKVIFLIKVKRMLYMDVLAHMILRHTLLKLEVYRYKKV